MSIRVVFRRRQRIQRCTQQPRSRSRRVDRFVRRMQALHIHRAAEKDETEAPLPLDQSATLNLRAFFASPPPPIHDFYFGLVMESAIQRLVVETDTRQVVDSADQVPEIAKNGHGRPHASNSGRDLDTVECVNPGIYPPFLARCIDRTMKRKGLQELEESYSRAVAEFVDNFEGGMAEPDAKRLKTETTPPQAMQIMAAASTLITKFKKRGLGTKSSRSSSSSASSTKCVMIPCYKLFQKVCISCERANSPKDCRFASERDMQGNISFGAQLLTENQITRPRGIERITLKDENRYILHHAASALQPLLESTARRSPLVPAVEHFRLRIRPKVGYMQCDACEAFLDLDHMRCMDCGQDFCLDCFAEWELACRAGAGELSYANEAHRARVELFRGCSRGLRHKLASFEFWTFVTPAAREHIYLHAQRNPMGLLEEKTSEAEAGSSDPTRILLHAGANTSETELLKLWRHRVPIVVSGIQFEQNWDPAVMKEVARYDDIINTRTIDGTRRSQMMFSEFVKTLPANTTKGFDFPAINKLENVFPAHWHEFRSKVPLRRLILRDGPLSLFSFLSNKDFMQLHGPTLFIAGAAFSESAGTTVLHKDNAGAYNVCMYAQDPSKPAAVWHLFSREDTRKIAAIYDRVDEDAYVMMDFTHYLDAAALEMLEREHGVRPFVLEQKVGDMILIPAGCAHQVRNLQLCVKISQDVITAECLMEAIATDAEFRFLPPGHERRSSTIACVGMGLLAWDRLNKYQKKSNSVIVASARGLNLEESQATSSDSLDASNSTASSSNGPATEASLAACIPEEKWGLKGKLNGRGRPGITAMMVPVDASAIRGYGRFVSRPNPCEDYLIQNKPCFHPFFKKFLRCGVCHPKNPTGGCVFINTRAFEKVPEDSRKLGYGPWFLKSRWDWAVERMRILGHRFEDGDIQALLERERIESQKQGSALVSGRCLLTPANNLYTGNNDSLDGSDEDDISSGGSNNEGTSRQESSNKDMDED
ncbi:hypothetical protein BC830DRAFT_1109225 [Chytriomyces sp. MP71]|nr:hypothetical protein BC830DRAFT_1109225 [Chytriomyces sp. MP71]